MFSNDLNTWFAALLDLGVRRMWLATEIEVKTVVPRLAGRCSQFSFLIINNLRLQAENPRKGSLATFNTGCS
jgi:hypothetical protein